MTNPLLKWFYLWRVSCRLTGCATGEHPCCHFCGADLYEGDFIERGALDPLISLYWRTRRLFVRDRRCGKPVSPDSTCLLTKGHEGECDDIPF